MRNGCSEGFLIVICATRAGGVRMTVMGEMSIVGPAPALPALHKAKPATVSTTIGPRIADRIELRASDHLPGGDVCNKLNVKVT